MNEGLNFRTPSYSTSTRTLTTSQYQPPPPDYLHGTWHVTHSTLPMWRNARNVSITYSPLPDSEGKLDDLVTYQSLTSDTTKSVKGIDTPVRLATVSSTTTHVNDVSTVDHAISSDISREANGSCRTEGDRVSDLRYSWRGKGWLMVASSKWEVIGWGKENEAEWAVTYFEKTLFTPRGIDLYSRRKEGVTSKLLEEIEGHLKKTDDGAVGDLVKDIFEVKRDL